MCPSPILSLPDDLMSSQEKPPISSKEVVISVSLAKDSDPDSSPTKVTSNQSSPLIIRGDAELLRLVPGEEDDPCNRFTASSALPCDALYRVQVSSQPR